MKLHFSKYHGTGNDFIIIDNRNNEVNLTKQEIKWLCDRHLGIGADGLMLLFHTIPFDFEMKYFNADGGEGTMCGNGGRCIVAYAHHLGMSDQRAHFLTIDGEHHGEILEQKDHISMIKVTLQDIHQIERNQNDYIINTGSPHYVKFVNSLEGMDIFNRGKEIRWDERFQPEGLNVNFVVSKAENLIVRTFERGVENITLSCGTGVTAAAVAADLKSNGTRNQYQIETLGGELMVRFEKQHNVYKNVSLTGPVKHVFDGSIEIP
ncbi:MAG: diaminopimelate epimerase [Bacteroidetes bacterium]|nr:diaminopimelate epimerase [Bacteroidota bacterium]